MKTNRLREYSQAALNSAIVCHQSGGMSSRKAAHENVVPYTTVRNYLLEPEKGQVGRQTKFSEDEEQAIAQILIVFAETKVPLSKAHLKQLICNSAVEKITVFIP